MKRFFAVSAMALLLSACGGSSGRNNRTACAERYWDGEVGLCLPSGWRTISKEALRQRNMPEEVVVAFQTEEALAGQFPTVTVTVEDLDREVTPADYSAASMRAVTALPNYTLIDTRDAIVDDAEVNLHIFTAQPIAEEPARRFFQISTVSDRTGYTFTGLTPVSVPDAIEKQVVGILESATFTDPNAVAEGTTDGEEEAVED